MTVGGSFWTTDPSFAVGALAAWSEERGVRLEFIQPGKPVQNAYVDTTPFPAGL